MKEPLEPTVYSLPRRTDPRGNLSFLQSGDQLPFEIARCYWLYDVPGDGSRDGHAFYTSKEVIIALSGSFDVVLDGGDGARQRFHLNRSYNALYIPPMYWRELDNFSTNSVGMVVASTLYSADDYIRDYEVFMQNARADKTPEE